MKRRFVWRCWIASTPTKTNGCPSKSSSFCSKKNRGRLGREIHINQSLVVVSLLILQTPLPLLPFSFTRTPLAQPFTPHTSLPLYVSLYSPHSLTHSLTQLLSFCTTPKALVIKYARQKFQEFDVNASGALDGEEIVKVVSTVPLPPSSLALSPPHSTPYSIPLLYLCCCTHLSPYYIPSFVFLILYFLLPPSHLSTEPTTMSVCRCV